MRFESFPSWRVQDRCLTELPTDWTARRSQNLFRTAGDSSEVFERTCATHAFVHLSTPSIVADFAERGKPQLSKFPGAVFQQKRFDAARQLIDGVAPEFRD